MSRAEDVYSNKKGKALNDFDNRQTNSIKFLAVRKT